MLQYSSKSVIEGTAESLHSSTNCEVSVIGVINNVAILESEEF